MTFFSDIDEYSVEFLSAAVVFELINSDHLGELGRLAVLDVIKKTNSR